ncbi:hypothetical protein MD484_g569, partial [Candolleomyces efflorescens]
MSPANLSQGLTFRSVLFIKVRLDKVVATANKYGLKVILTLTNNWNPERVTARRQISGPRGHVPNDYGGIDAYVRNFKPGGTHDLFYTDENIIKAFKFYVKAVVSRFSAHPTVLAWELGNDLRCSSTLPGSSGCNPQTITKWAAKVAGYIKELDHKHLVTVGDSGFFCLECPKLLANKTTSRRPALGGPSFDGSFGIDTEDLLAIPHVDFGSFQISPELQLFPVLAGVNPTDQSIGDGGRWIEVHSQTAQLLEKPEVLLSAAVLTKSNCRSFSTIPCRGVDDFEATYAVSSWGSASLNGNIEGVLEASPFLPQFSRTSRRQEGTGRYDGPATSLNARQFAMAAPPI